MKLKRHIEFINESNKEKFIFRFYQDCEECNGSGYIDTQESCSWCRGAGFNVEYDENDMNYDVDCEKCGGSGENIINDGECTECKEGKLVWNIVYIQGEGVDMVHEDYGNSDHPNQFQKGGPVAYDNPGLFPVEIKDVVKHVFDNKDLSIEDMANSIALYMAKEKYSDGFEMGDTMKEYFNDDTKRILSGSKTISKFKL